MSPCVRIRKFPFLLALVLGALLGTSPAFASGGVGDMYVTSDASNLVRAYDEVTGTYLGIHSSSVLGIGQLGIHFGATNNRFLVGSFGGGVDEFDAATGAYIKTYNPGGTWQWTGIYHPITGEVIIGQESTNDIRRYDPNTGAFLGMWFPFYSPADMKVGPNGNLFVCSYNGGFVQEHDINTGALVATLMLPAGARANDIDWLPNGNPLVTAMGYNVVFHFDNAYNIVGQFFSPGWGNPHGIEIHPSTGNIMVIDGILGQCHIFDPVTFNLLNATFLSPAPGDKVVDLDFRPDGGPVPVQPSTWSRIKNLAK
jgi:WD40 repeat protein